MDTELIHYCFNYFVTDLELSEKKDSKYVYMFGYQCKSGFMHFKMHVHVPALLDAILLSDSNCGVLPYSTMEFLNILILKVKTLHFW